jgi:hypothetical protein
MEVVVAEVLLARVNVAVASVPLAIAVAFDPDAIHV